MATPAEHPGMTQLSVVILARDEAEMLPGCLARLGFADEIIVVVDDRSTDATASLAQAAGARVLSCRFSSFAQAKQMGVDAAAGDWVFIVDADERVTHGLASEVLEIVKGVARADAWRVPIRNWFFGQAMSHGGWASERPIRLVRRPLARLVGEIHETIDMQGVTVDECANPLEHFSHRSIHHNLAKTTSWLDISAAQLAASGTGTVTARKLWAVVGRELAWRFVRRRGWKDDTVGTIESLYQAFSQFAVAVRLWEMQQTPSLEERYRLLEEEL